MSYTGLAASLINLPILLVDWKIPWISPKYDSDCDLTFCPILPTFYSFLLSRLLSTGGSDASSLCVLGVLWNPCQRESAVRELLCSISSQRWSLDFSCAPFSPHYLGFSCWFVFVISSSASLGIASGRRACHPPSSLECSLDCRSYFDSSLFLRSTLRCSSLKPFQSTSLFLALRLQACNFLCRYLLARTLSLVKSKSVLSGALPATSLHYLHSTASLFFVEIQTLWTWMKACSVWMISTLHHLYECVAHSSLTTAAHNHCS